MNISELLDRLFKENNFNPYSFSVRYGGTDVTYRDILTGKTGHLSYKVKSRIEHAFNIRINDKDPKNITYKKLENIIHEDPEIYNVTEVRKILKKLKELGIDSEYKLNKFFDIEDITEDIKELLNKRISNQRRKE